MFDSESYILIVDDSAGMRHLLKQILKDLKFSNVVEAGDGQDASNKLEALSKKGIQVSLIICDLRMPVMDGFSFLKKVKSDSNFKSIPFLVSTAISDAENVVDILTLGAADYVVKPFDKPKVTEKLTAIWKRQNS